MRIAISGTHCMGKTTLANDFIKAHPEYTYEPEPYYQLQELYGVEFSHPPTLEDFIKQLEYNIQRIEELKDEENVIFERCPIDFLCYASHLIYEEGISLYDGELTDRFVDIRHALTQLDLIVYLPITPENLIPCPESENLELRNAVDDYLKETYQDDLLDILPRHNRPEIIEIWGNPEERVQKLEFYLL